MNQWEFLLWVLTGAAALIILATPIYVVLYTGAMAIKSALKDSSKQ